MVTLSFKVSKKQRRGVNRKIDQKGVISNCHMDLSLLLSTKLGKKCCKIVRKHPSNRAKNASDLY